LQNGVLAGFPMPSLKVTLLDGSYHNVDSDSLSFEICAKFAFREACSKAKKVILEPIMKLEVSTYEEYIGDVMNDLNKRRAQLEAIENKMGSQIINAKVPLSQMFGYVTDLRTITSGRASSVMEFSHYQEMSKEMAEQVVFKMRGMKVTL
jgi:elongation factor G